MLAGTTSAGGEMSRAANEMAVRRVLREMKRHHAELMLRPQPAPVDAGRAWPLWAVPMAAAAAALFLFIGLWGVGVIEFDPVVGGVTGEIAIIAPDGGEEMELVEEPVEFYREQFVILDEVGHYLEEAAMHVEQLQELDSDEGDALLLMKDPV
jgi:hypothetical protein